MQLLSQTRSDIMQNDALLAEEIKESLESSNKYLEAIAGREIDAGDNALSEIWPLLHELRVRAETVMVMTFFRRKVASDWHKVTHRWLTIMEEQHADNARLIEALREGTA